MIVTLQRLVDFPRCTIGRLNIRGLYTLELSWRYDHSWKPSAGTYETVKDQETGLFSVDRGGILIHADNDTKSGILVGLTAGIIGRQVVVLDSRRALGELWKRTPDEFLLNIEEPYA